jgi:histidinol phosphatase-like enzyme (inositol monophosphatase family)
MSLPALPELTQFFNTLCETSAAQTLPMFRTSMRVVNKLEQDFDPVTEADRQAEISIRTRIEEHFPDHGIIGEEFGRIRPQAQYQWIIDPIDDNGVPLAGVMDQPFTRERYLSIGGRSKLAVANEEPVDLNTSAVSQLDQAILMTTSPNLLTGEKDRAYFNVENKVKLVRYGCDCYAYCQLAAGQVDLVIESGLNIYDIAALIAIVEGAGGLITDWAGGDASQGGFILAAANADIHAQALEQLNSS